ncbi:MAG TPA: PD-(D/E)XK nuclease family protein [Thermotogota bacterium]|nr:PD-(D/E)XK nuclease family protein [Thermotogota bacterium]HRW91320.1 PD-(D/E)XK nuclease family protein [Thermotogota bacterium]
MQLSFSKLTTFEQCPARFAFAYIRQIPKKKSSALFLGEVVHSTLEQVFQDQLPGSMPLFSQQHLQQLFRETWKQKRNLYRSRDELEMPLEEEISAGKRGLQMLEHFSQSPFFFAPREIESFFAVSMDEQTVFVGRVDRVDEQQGIARVVDYKTGKYSPSYVNHFQLQVYAWLLQRNGIQVQQAAYYFLEENQVSSIEVDSFLLEQTAEELEERVQNMVRFLETQPLLPTPNRLCGWCEYRDICPAHAG